MASAKEKVSKREENERVENTREKRNKKKNKKGKVFIIFIIIFIILALVFSVIFAFMQKGKNTIVKGVSAKGVELSNLTVSDAKEKLVEQLNKELNVPIKLVYNDEYNLDINLSEIEFAYKLDEMVDSAYKIGRTDNIFESNYSILDTMINGTDIEIQYTFNEDALNNIISNIDSEIPGKVIEATYDIEDDELLITPGTDGIAVKDTELKETILNSIKNRDSFIEGKEYQEIKIPVENKSAEAIDIEKIYEEVHSEPQDAYLIKEPFELVKDVSGVDFKVSIEEAKALITGDKEEYTIPLKITPANKRVADLGDEAFPNTIATYSTEYNAGQTGRTTNLRIAANKVNGTVLLPGEEFSFNKVVGKRTVQDGYQNAIIYENGKAVDGLAGGICQISSTLYNAVLLANLEIVERRNHSFTSTYVPAGRDATVVYGSIDFKFKNNRKYPIKLISSVSGGIARFEIKGMKEETEYEVKITTQTTQEIPCPEERQDDDTMPKGTETVVQAGHSGAKVSSYRTTYLNGTQVSRELLANDTYKAMARVIKVGTQETEEPAVTIEDITGQEEKTDDTQPAVTESVIPTEGNEEGITPENIEGETTNKIDDNNTTIPDSGTSPNLDGKEPLGDNTETPDVTAGEPGI